MKLRHYLLAGWVLMACLGSCKHESALINPDPDTEPPTFPAEQTPTGQSLGSPVSQTIGPAGGSITLPSQGLTLRFPAGALKENTPIRVQAVENKAIGGVGPAVEIEPKETKLNKPVEIVWHYTKKAINGTAPNAIGLAEQQANGTWLGSLNLKLDEASQTLTTSWPNLDFAHPVAYYAQFYLKYPQDQIVVNQEVPLIVAFQPNHSDAIEAIERKTLLAALKTWTPVNGSLVDNWLINGEDPVNQTTDRRGKLGVSGEGEKATYFASDRVPPQSMNPIAVSVELKTKGRGKIILVANLDVIGGNGFTVNGVHDDNPETSVTATGDNYLFISLSEGDANDPDNPAGLSGQIRDYKGPGTYELQADDLDHVRRDITASNGGREGKTWRRTYRQHYAPYDIQFAKGRITISTHDRQSGLIIGRIDATLYYQPDRSKAAEQATVSGTFRTVVQ